METTAKGIPVLDVDPYAVGHLLDPYTLHHALREAGPVVYLSKYETYATARYEEVKTVMEDWRGFTSATGAGIADLTKPDAYRALTAIVEVDPPVHTAVRATVQKILSPKIVRGWHEDFRRAAVTMVDDLIDRQDIDGVLDIAEPYVTTVFPAALGIETDRHNLIIAGNYVFNSHGPHNELYWAAKEQFEGILEWFNATRRRESLIPGGFGEQLYLAEDAGDFSPGVAESLMGTFLRGGLDTTISGIGTTLMYLSRDPAAWRDLRKDPSRAKLAFEEAIRLESPACSWYRATTAAVELGGVMLEPHKKIHVFAGAANRDPRQWEHPDAFDITRSTIGHLALGRGIHVCIGQMIARLEAECILTALLDRVETLTPRGDPKFRPLNNLRTLDALPLSIVAA